MQDEPPDQLAPSRFKDTGTLKTNMVDGWSCNLPRRLVSRRMNWGEILKILVRRIWVAGGKNKVASGEWRGTGGSGEQERVRNRKEGKEKAEGTERVETFQT